MGASFVLDTTFSVSPLNQKLLIHRQNLAYASSGRKLYIAVLGLGARYDEDSGITVGEKISLGLRG